jgi:hypothetical protein
MIIRVLFSFILFTAVLYANTELTGQRLANTLGINAASKAIMQWERVFKNQHKMKRYKINTLPKKDQEILKEYLINHAIDSDNPTVAGV